MMSGCLDGEDLLETDLDFLKDEIDKFYEELLENIEIRKDI